jgi:hypothetical protein
MQGQVIDEPLIDVQNIEEDGPVGT